VCGDRWVSLTRRACTRGQLLLPATVPPNKPLQRTDRAPALRAGARPAAERRVVRRAGMARRLADRRAGMARRLADQLFPSRRAASCTNCKDCAVGFGLPHGA
jgi:hypothetical protein